LAGDALRGSEQDLISGKTSLAGITACETLVKNRRLLCRRSLTPSKNHGAIANQTWLWHCNRHGTNPATFLSLETPYGASCHDVNAEGNGPVGSKTQD